MNKIIFKIILNYINNEILKNKIEENNKFLDNIDNLYNAGKISLEEQDEILDNFYEYLNSYINILCNCPFLNICIQCEEKGE